MNIHEYQAKQLLAKYGVAVLKGGVAYAPAQVYEALGIRPFVPAAAIVSLPPKQP